MTLVYLADHMARRAYVQALTRIRGRWASSPTFDNLRNVDPDNGDLSTRVDSELAKSLFRRRSRYLSHLYDERSAEKRLSVTRAIVTLLTVFYVISIGTDLFFVPDIMTLSMICRIVVIPTIAIFIVAESYQKPDARRFEREAAIAIVIAVMLWCLLLFKSGHHHGAIDYFMVAPVFLVVSAIFSNLPFALAVYCTGTIYLILMGTLVFLAAADIDVLAVNGCILSWTTLLTLFVSRRLDSERFSNFLYELKMGLQQDVIVAQNAKLLRLSEIDALTDVANRRALDEALSRYWLAWSGQGKPFALFLIDVDFFKRFNDHYGHQAGDACLRDVADALAHVARANGGMIGRFGGEEFVVLTPTDRVAAAAVIGEELRGAVADLQTGHVKRPDDLSFITVSVGVAFSGLPACGGVETMLGFADEALYLAKASGRNNVRAYAEALGAQIAVDPPIVAFSGVVVAGREPIARCA